MASIRFPEHEIVKLTNLAIDFLHNTQSACGKYHELNNEVYSLYTLLTTLQSSASSPRRSLKPHNDDQVQGLNHAIDRLHFILDDLNKVLLKYKALDKREQAKSGEKIWAKIQFGNGPMRDLSETREKIRGYMGVINAHLSVGVHEKLDIIAAKFERREQGSVLSSCDGDDEDVWKEIRRELRASGYNGSFIKKWKKPILEHIVGIGLTEPSGGAGAGANVTGSSQEPGRDGQSNRESLPGALPNTSLYSEDPLNEVEDEQDQDILSDICEYGPVDGRDWASEGDSPSEDRLATENDSASEDYSVSEYDSISEDDSVSEDDSASEDDSVSEENHANHHLESPAIDLRNKIQLDSHSGSISTGTTREPLGRTRVNTRITAISEQSNPENTSNGKPVEQEIREPTEQNKRMKSDDFLLKRKMEELDERDRYWIAFKRVHNEHVRS